MGRMKCEGKGRDALVLVRDGKPTSSLIIAREATHAAQFAATELQWHIKQITGAEVPILRDDQKAVGVRVLVGESAATKKLGLTSQSFKPQEYAICFRRDALILIGRDKPTPPPENVHTSGDCRWVSGKWGKALSFASGNAALTVDNCGFADERGTMSVWVWIPGQPEEHEGTILRLDGSNPWTYHILRHTGRRVAYVTYDGKAGSGVTSSELPEGWHHVVATHDANAGKIELFIDGASAGTAKFTSSTCKEARLHIGGIALSESDAKVGNPFVGMLDEVQLSTEVLRPQDFADPRVRVTGATLVLHFDEGRGVPQDSSGILRPIAPPAPFDEQGTCYAVYDFLERYCGVRWFAPTELGMVCPSRVTLQVSGTDVRRAPFFRFRQGSYMPVYGLLREVWNHPTQREVQLYACRMRLGGEPYAANHSFYGYYERFWKKESPYFEGEHPDWFAQGYSGMPPQMCYTNEGFIRQVIQDARDYFDGKGTKVGAQANGDYFALVPMDNSAWCKCQNCQAQLNPEEKENPHFSNGWASDYIFGFANKVAKAIRQSHPHKFLATLAYSSYAYYPKRIRLESNIAVQMCLHVRNWWAPSMEENDMKFYRSWVSREKDRPLYLWLYYTFPEEVAINGKWHCFPGFFAHTLDRQWKMFARDGIRGAFLNNLGEYLDTYLTFRLMDDPWQNVDKMIEEFHRLYYGAAARPMQQLYLQIESIYSNPANYPEEIRTGKKHSHQTEEIAWGYLGTAERMAQLQKLMEEAKALASTDVEKKRVALFERGIWEYMVEGRRRWEARRALLPEVERLKSQPPPVIRVPRIAPAHGDCAKVDWSQSVVLDNWRTVQGYPASRRMEARLAHDAEFLYGRCLDRVETKGLVSNDHIWAGDDWEIFFALQRKPPYRQVGINPRGKHEDLVYGGGEKIGESEVRVMSDATAPDRWVAYFAFPLARLLPGGLRSGSKFYANFYRATADNDGRDYFAWSPNFCDSFHELSRMGEMTLE